MERNSFAGTDGWIIGGAKGYVGPPSQIIGGGGPGPPWPPLFLRLCVMILYNVLPMHSFFFPLV